MKRIQRLIAGAGLLVSAAGPLYAATPKTAEDYLSLAARYEQKAQEQQAVIAEHEQMKKEGVTEKTPVSLRQKMEKHCDAIIKDAAKLKEDYLVFAQYNKMRAAELKGQN